VSNQVGANPVLRMSDDPDDAGSILELKTRLVLYLDAPPAAGTVRSLYDLYVVRYGRDITHYRSTTFGDFAEDWTPDARRRFEQAELPALYQHMDWGYMFGADRPADARVFLFHGSRPASEPERASIVRFDFEWNFDADEMLQFTARVLEQIECVCGTAGYVLAEGDADSAGSEESVAFAAAMRYWGAEAQDLDVSLDVTLQGFPCIGWVTVIGPGLLARNRAAAERAHSVAHASFEINGHAIIQAEEQRRLIDRNRREPLGNYPAVAEALLPLQVRDHPSFRGDHWDEDLTRRYLHRFTHPQDL
jgi:hypothetical protein